MFVIFRRNIFRWLSLSSASFVLENRTIEKLILQATANRVHSSFPILASSMLEAFSPLTGFHASLGCVNVNGLTRFYRVRGHRHFRGGRLKYPPKSDQAERSSNGKKTRTLWTVNWIDVKTRRKRKEKVDRYWRIRRKIIEDEMKGRIRSLSHDDSYISWLTILFYTFFFIYFRLIS